MSGSKISEFNPALYMSSLLLSRQKIRVQANEAFYSQGDAANSVYYLEVGRAKLIVVSRQGKEAAVSLMVPNDFIGEESLTGPMGLHSATALAITAFTAVKVDRGEMIRLLHKDDEFSDMFLKSGLIRTLRTQENLIDQLFNNSEKRLARTLLLMAQRGEPGEPQGLIPPVTQGALAEMVGTTRSRVSHFMNRFRKLGYIRYNGRIHVDKALLSAMLHDQFPEQRTERPILLNPERTTVKRKTHATIA